MEVFFLMAGLALVVFIAIFRRTSSRSARALPAVPNIEVRDRAIARSMLVDHADTFSDRPVSPFHVKFVRAERVNLSYSISTVPHGPLWRALRCNLTAGILHPSRLGRLAGLQREAVDGLVASLSSSCCRGGRARDDDDVVVIRDGLHTAVLTLQMRMCFGDGGFDAGDVRAVQRVLKDFFDGMVDAPVLATSRTARLLHWRRWRRFLAVRSRMTKLLLPLIMERRRRRQSMSMWCSDSGDDGGGGIRPFVDSLLDLHVPSYDDGSVRRALTDDEKANLVWEFLGAGTETVVSCVEWALAHLVNQPEVQEKLRREVDVHGGSDTPTPYLRAVILESLRLHPPVAVIQRDVVVRSVDDGGGGAAAAVIGVHVPPEEEDGSSGVDVVRFTIVPGAIGRDSRTWTDDADEFRPERFLAGGEGEAVGPMPGPKDVRMLPFGAGTRHCPGMALGMVHYWKSVLCRVPETLPSAKSRGTRQSNILPSAALGKIKHSAKLSLPSAKHSGKKSTRRNRILPSAKRPAKKSARQIFSPINGGDLPSNFAERLT